MQQYSKVKPKKNLGQHFLNDILIAEKIVDALTMEGYQSVLEVGPGMGVLTNILLQRAIDNFKAVEIDDESLRYLRKKYPHFEGLVKGDILHIDISSLFGEQYAVIGNFPYNISSQILFRVLENRAMIPEICGMFQKEVAERICSPAGGRNYGILSVFIQAYYNAEYLFTVDENNFTPPPKVKSGVIRLRRNGVSSLNCNEKLFEKVVKTGFNQRRKTLRNSLSAAFDIKDKEIPFLNLRPEQLSVQQFVDLTNSIDK